MEELFHSLDFLFSIVVVLRRFSSRNRNDRRSWSEVSVQMFVFLLLGSFFIKMRFGYVFDKEGFREKKKKKKKKR